MKNFVTIVGVAVGFTLLIFFDVMSLGVVPDAEAIAGVRRRTARRTAVIVGSSTAAAASASSAATAQQQSATAQQQSATAQQQAAAAAPAPTAMVASLPAGCVADGQVFQCGNVYYKAYMSGSTIVYGVVPGP
jgi:cysteine synthase